MTKSFNNFRLRQKRGFTLIELLIGMTVFVLIMGSLTSLIYFSFQLTRKKSPLVEQEVLNQLSFAIEYMSRALRMAVREGGTTACLSATGLNYENPVGQSSIRFINHLQADDCQEFFLSGNAIQYRKGIGVAPVTLPLTSPNVRVESLDFRLSGASQADNLQPRVTISLRVTSPVQIDLQTTITQRNLDISFGPPPPKPPPAEPF